jgi:transcription initiation factor TFIID subunit 6
MSDPTGGVADGGNDRVSPESIKIIAQTVGIEALPDEVARALAPDVEYRLREVIQDALKFARHSKRSAISTEDVNASLRLRDVEPLYGFPAGAGPVPFREVPGQPELFFQEQKELQLKDVLAAKLPRPPVAVNVVPHWLAVEGVQPVIPENPNPDPERARAGVGAGADAPRARDFRAPVAPDEVVAPVGTAPRAPRDAGDASGSQPGVVVEPTLTHELSKELQLYFDRVTATVRGGGVGPEAPVLRAALESLQTDNGIHQLVPYFVRFAQEEVATSLKNLPRLTAVIAAVRALVSNPHVHVELYLHQLMPSVVTCLVAKKLGGEPSDLDDHCLLRERAAETMALVCAKFGEQYPTIQPRITRTLVKALLDQTKPLATRYGAVVGLAALGPRVTRLLILPHLRQVLETLEPMLAEGEEESKTDSKTDAAKSEEKARRRRRDARRVHDALKRAVGACLHAALAVPSAEANAASEPERRAARKNINAASAASGSVGPRSSAPGAGSVAGWKIGKAPGTLRVDVAGAETEIAIGDAVLSDTSEDPKAVAAKVAAAAALLGDCVVPYAAVPEAAGAFI